MPLLLLLPLPLLLLAHIYANTHSCMHTHICCEDSRPAHQFSVWIRYTTIFYWVDELHNNFGERRAAQKCIIYRFSHTFTRADLDRERERERKEKTHSSRISFFGFSVRRQFLTRKHDEHTGQQFMYNTSARSCCIIGKSKRTNTSRGKHLLENSVSHSNLVLLSILFFSSAFH